MQVVLMIPTQKQTSSVQWRFFHTSMTEAPMVGDGVYVHDHFYKVEHRLWQLNEDEWKVTVRLRP